MRLIFLAATLCALAGPAFAGQPVTLRMDVATLGPVTLGDLFDGAGAAAKIVVAPAVASGSVTLDVATVQRAALRAGLDWQNPQGIRRIIVHAGESAGTSAPLPAAAPAPASSLPAAAPAPAGAVEVLAYAHSLDAGEIVQPDDLTWAKAVRAPAGAPHDADQIIGKQVRRPLREGASASLRDVASPVVIKKDDMVTVTFATDGINVTMTGKATAAASLGDTVAILNPNAKKVIQAIASGPGQAVIGPEADRLHAESLGLAQFAVR